jgi:hypothetical protein
VASRKFSKPRRLDTEEFAPPNAEPNVSARAISPSTAWTLRGFAIAFARLRTSAQHRHAIAGKFKYHN